MLPITYGRQNITQEDIDAVVEALQSPYMTQGPKIDMFEKKVAEFIGVKYAVSFSNGTAALHGAYYASGITKGDEFITSPNTFVASANAGLYMGATPKFVDIDMTTYNLDINRLKENITENTKVVTPVSFAGNPVNLKKIRQIIGDEITIIHDAAHAIGARINGNNIVDYADMTILSFHPVKHVATGEGGMVLTNSKELYEKLLMFRSHGITKEIGERSEKEPWAYEMKELGFNYRITDLQAALGITQMDKLEESLIKRNQIADLYRKNFNDISEITLPEKTFEDDISELTDVKNVDNIHSYHLFPILLDSNEVRKQLYDYLKEKQIFTQVHYIPVHTQPYYQEKFGFSNGDFPNAENYYSRELSLPMYPTLSTEQLSYVISSVREFFKKEKNINV